VDTKKRGMIQERTEIGFECCRAKGGVANVQKVFLKGEILGFQLHKAVVRHMHGNDPTNELLTDHVKGKRRKKKAPYGTVD